MERLRTATRPVVTLLVAAAVVAGFLVGRISSAEFLPLAALVISWWFRDRERQGEKS